MVDRGCPQFLPQGERARAGGGREHGRFCLPPLQGLFSPAPRHATWTRHGPNNGPLATASGSCSLVSNLIRLCADLVRHLPRRDGRRAPDERRHEGAFPRQHSPRPQSAAVVRGRQVLHRELPQLRGSSAATRSRAESVLMGGRSLEQFLAREPCPLQIRCPRFSHAMLLA